MLNYILLASTKNQIICNKYQESPNASYYYLCIHDLVSETFFHHTYRSMIRNFANEFENSAGQYFDAHH